MAAHNNKEILYIVQQGNKSVVCEFRGTTETDRGTMLKMRPKHGGRDILASPQDVTVEHSRQSNPSLPMSGEFGTFGDSEMRRNNPQGYLEDGRKVIWVREAKPHEKGTHYSTLEDGRKVFWVRELKGEGRGQSPGGLRHGMGSKLQAAMVGRSANPYGVLKDGRPVLWVKEYLPHEVWYDGENVKKPKNTGDLLSELTGLPIRWMQGIGFVVLSELGQNEILGRKAVVKKAIEKYTQKKYQSLDTGTRVSDFYNAIKEDLTDFLQRKRKESFAKGAWAKATKEEKNQFYRGIFGEALAGTSTTEAIERMGYQINLRNQAFLNGRLGDFLREHPEVVEAVAEGKRIGPDTLSDIEEHAFKLGYADVRVGARGQVQLVKPRYQELDRDVRAIVPYIQPQQPARAKNPYLSYMAPRSGTDGGTQHRERGYVDFSTNTYSPVSGSRYFDVGTEYEFVADKDSSNNLMKAAALVSFAENRMSHAAKMEANRRLFDFIKAAKMTNKEFTDFMAYLAQESQGVIGAKGAKIKAAPQWQESEGHFLQSLQAAAAKSGSPRAKKAVKEAVVAVSVLEEAKQELQAAQEVAQEAAQEAKEAVVEAVEAEKKAKKAPTVANKAKAKKAKKEATEAKEEATEAKAEVAEKVQEVQVATIEATEAIQEAAQVVQEETGASVPISTDAMLAASIAPSSKGTLADAIAQATQGAGQGLLAKLRKQPVSTTSPQFAPATISSPIVAESAEEERARKRAAAKAKMAASGISL